MNSKWSDEKASEFVGRFGSDWGDDLALRIYTSRMLGSEKALVLHGGGNTSVKGLYTDVVGEEVPALFMKASGFDLKVIEPEGHPAVNLTNLGRLRSVASFSDDEMASEIRTHLFDYRAATPSIETLVHAFIKDKYVDHSHADAILALTNQKGGRELVEEALGGDALVLDYVKPGFQLAKLVAEALDKDPGARAMVWMKHGLVTWGKTAKESYEAHIQFVTLAEEFLESKSRDRAPVEVSTSVEEAEARWVRTAPILRGLLAEPSGDPDRPYQRVVLRSSTDRETLVLVASKVGKRLALSHPHMG